MHSLCVLGRGHRVAAGRPLLMPQSRDNGPPHGCSWLTSVFSVAGTTVFLQGMALEDHTDLTSSLFFPPYSFFLLEYHCFTMLCWFLLHNDVNLLCVCISPLRLEPRTLQVTWL